MNRRSLLSLVAASAGLLCGARSAEPEPLVEILKGEWDRSAQYDTEGNPTGNSIVGITAIARNVGAMKGIKGEERSMEWPDGLVARALSRNACVPPVPANRMRMDVRITVESCDFLDTTRRITCRYLEARTPRWR
jgi:hypothetical protein